jgi:glycosyltransferase involved in cell wall biosynthesis
MRLTLVTSALSAGGAERVLSTMANYWAEKGWQVHLATFDNGKEPPFYPLHPAVVHEPLGIAGKSANPGAALLRNLGRLRALRDALRRAAPRAVVSFLERPNVLTLLASAGLGVPVVVSERSDPHSQAIGRAWSALRRLTYPRAAAVVAQTEQALGYFSAAVRRRGRVIPNPIQAVPPPANGAAHAGAGGRKTVLGLGRLSPEKGFDHLLRAFGRVAPRHRDWGLDIWGEGPERPRLAALVQELGLADRVRLPGRTPEPLAQMRRADFFVLSSRYEGFPNALCEALACGLPAISYACPTGPRAIIRDGVDGVLVPAGEVGALAAAMDRLMADEGERRRLALRAPEAVARFQLPQVMSQWEDVLAEVVR